MKLKVEKNPKDDPLFQRRRELLDECKNILGTIESGKKALNILVVGPPGSGKTAFLNTIFASLNESKWIEYEKYSKKVSSRSFKCYEKEFYYDSQDTYLIPSFLSMTGLEDENSEVNRELLEIVLSGKIKDGENLSEIIHLGKYNLLELRKKYNSRSVYKKVDRIIVVCSMSSNTNPPALLLEAIADVAGQKAVTIYGVLTHADCSEEVDDGREVQFRQLLGIPEHRCTRIMNYCTAVDQSHTFMDTFIPTLDVPVLELLRQVFIQEKNEQKVSEPPPLKTQRILTETLLKYRWILLSFVVVAVAVWNWYIMMLLCVLVLIIYSLFIWKRN